MLGRLDGRLAALEDWMRRYETSSAARLSTIESKLDAINTSIAQGLGGARVVHWIGGAALAILGYLTNHLWQRSG